MRENPHAARAMPFGFRLGFARTGSGSDAEAACVGLRAGQRGASLGGCRRFRYGPETPGPPFSGGLMNNPKAFPLPSPYELLIQGVVDYAIFMLDPDGRVASWNPGAQRIKGYAAEEIIGEHFSRFYPEEEH